MLNHWLLQATSKKTQPPSWSLQLHFPTTWKASLMDKVLPIILFYSFQYVLKGTKFSLFWLWNWETFVSEVGNRSTTFVMTLREVSSGNPILLLEGRNFLFPLPYQMQLLLLVCKVQKLLCNCCSIVFPLLFCLVLWMYSFLSCLSVFLPIPFLSSLWC